MIREVKTYELTTTSGGQPLPDASVLINDEPLMKEGQPVVTPATIELEFTRESGAAKWNTYSIKSLIENEFEPTTTTIDRATPLTLTHELAPVTEVPVIRYFPTTAMTVRGPKLELDQSAPLGMLDFRDQMGNYSENRRITNYKRSSPSLAAVNSFAITPDGQQVIYSLTQESRKWQILRKPLHEGSKRAVPGSSTTHTGHPVLRDQPDDVIRPRFDSCRLPIQPTGTPRLLGYHRHPRTTRSYLGRSGASHTRATLQLCTFARLREPPALLHRL